MHFSVCLSVYVRVSVHIGVSVNACEHMCQHVCVQHVPQVHVHASRVTKPWDLAVVAVATAVPAVQADP